MEQIAEQKAEQKVEPVEDHVAVERLRVEVIATYPHDPQAFTQGLVWDGGILYESTGLYGSSSVRRVDPMSGRVLLRRAIDPGLFSEGLALFGDHLILLSWQEGIALVLELTALEIVDQHTYPGEGWGLTHDGRRLVMSDGSDVLTLRNPTDFRALSTLAVTLDGHPVSQLNELEVAQGQIYANVWQQDFLVRIDPQTGKVNAVIDASGLLTPEESQRADVLNGIAYDPVSQTFWITGKLWPKLFQVRFIPARSQT